MKSHPLAQPVSPALSRRDAMRTLAMATGALALPTWLGGSRLQAAPVALPASSTPPPFVSTPLKEGITLITGAVCNILVVNGEDGGVVLDSGIPDAAEATASQIAQVAPKLNLLVNTHWHFDHAGGNERLARTGLRIIAHENCRKRLSTDQYNEAFDRKSPASPKSALPVVTFTSETRLHVNGEDFQLLPVPPAHTDGDIIVHLEKANLVHMGDLFFNKMYPFIDYSSGGWIGGMIEAVKIGLPLTDAQTVIIPGHGPVGNQDDLKKFLHMMQTVYERMVKAKEAGKKADEVIAAAPTKEFDEEFGGGFFKPEQFVRVAYDGLLRHG